MPEREGVSVHLPPSPPDGRGKIKMEEILNSSGPSLLNAVGRANKEHSSAFYKQVFDSRTPSEPLGTVTPLFINSPGGNRGL
jgi:hypothetical protein